METILAVIFGAFFLVLAYRHLDWAFFISVAALPAYLLRFSLGPLPSTLLEVMILATFVGWFAKNLPAIKKSLTGQLVRQPYPFGLETILILAIAFLALVPSGFSLSSLGIWRAYFFEPLLLFIIAANLFIQKKNREYFLYAITASALAASLLAIYQKLTGDLIANPYWADLATRRVTAWFPYPNALGLYLAPIAAILGAAGLGCLEKKSYHQAAIYWTIAALAAISIYFAKSDGALVALTASAFLVLLLWKPWSRKAVLVLAIVGLEVLWLSPYRQAAIDKFTLFDLSGQIRKQQWTETWQLLKHNQVWLWGTGLDNYQPMIAPYHQDGIFVENHDPDWYRKVVWDDEYKAQVWQPVEIYKYPHNIFLNFWTELGLLGLLAFIWLLGKATWLAIRTWNSKEQDRYYGLAAFAAIIAIIVQGLVDVPYFKNDLSAFFWVLLAWIGMTDREYRPIWKKK